VLCHRCGACEAAAGIVVDGTAASMLRPVSTTAGLDERTTKEPMPGVGADATTAPAPDPETIGTLTPSCGGATLLPVCVVLAGSPGDANGTRAAMGAAILDVPGDGGSGRKTGLSSKFIGPCSRSKCESCSYNAAILALYIFSVPSLADRLFRS